MNHHSPLFFILLSLLNVQLFLKNENNIYPFVICTLFPLKLFSF